LAIIERLSKVGEKLGLSIASRKRLGLRFGEEAKQKTLFDFLNETILDDDELGDEY
jgi:hypothetical protein